MDADRHWMRRALELARATTSLASPNPQVGCVLVRDGQMLGEGAHLYSQRDHAEIAALKMATAQGHSPAGATAYVTLEPCSHHGRTPPCADALIVAGVARVVVATQDPNPLVAGRGLARLQEAGVEVTVGVLQAEAQQLNEAWAFSMLHHRPQVTLKSALSVDGRLAPLPHLRVPGQPHWLTGPEARAEVQRMRHRSDAVLTGIGTVLADDPMLTDRSGLPRRRPLLRVVLDPLARLPLASQLVRSLQEDLLLLVAEEAPAERTERLQAAGVAVQAVPALPPAGPHRRPRLDLPAALGLLNQQDEPLRSVLLEAGPALNGAFLHAELVDRVALFYAPAELGPASLPFATSPDRGEINPFLLEQALGQIQRSTFGQDAFVSGVLHRAWPVAEALP